MTSGISDQLPVAESTGVPVTSVSQRDVSIAGACESVTEGACEGVTASLAAVQVAQFHRAYELPLRTSPTVEVGAAQVALRLALIEEEVRELREAAEAGDLVEVADALADIVYVAYGTAHVYGVDLDAVLTEVHDSNMTKLGADGRPVRRADGKVLKGPSYRAPEVARILAQRGFNPNPPA